MTELYLRNIFRLNSVNSEALHKVRHDVRVLFRLAHDFYRLVDIQQYFAETEEQMQLFALSVEVEGERPADALHSEFYPFFNYRPNAEKPRLAVDEDVEIAGEVVLQGRFFEELCHKNFGVGAAPYVDCELEAVKVNLIAHVGDFLELSVLYHIGQLFENQLNRR